MHLVQEECSEKSVIDLEPSLLLWEQGDRTLSSHYMSLHSACTGAIWGSHWCFTGLSARCWETPLVRGPPGLESCARLAVWWSSGFTSPVCSFPERLWHFGSTQPGACSVILRVIRREGHCFQSCRPITVTPP